MSKNKDLAFPVTHTPAAGVHFAAGLTKREYIATKVLAAIVSSPLFNQDSNAAVTVAVEVADELLAQLKLDSQEI